MALAVCFWGAAVCQADEPIMGTWKLNEAKSKLAPGATKNHTIVYEAAGDSVKVTVDGTDSKGQAVHSEWTGKFDGKDYPVTGGATSDVRSYKKVNDRTFTFTAKKEGKVTLTGRIVISADGKSRTVSTTATDANGKKVGGSRIRQAVMWPAAGQASNPPPVAAHHVFNMLSYKSDARTFVRECTCVRK